MNAAAWLIATHGPGADRICVDPPKPGHYVSLVGVLEAYHEYRRGEPAGLLTAAEDLERGWKRYTELFGTGPHGTKRQLAALLELCPDLFFRLRQDTLREAARRFRQLTAGAATGEGRGLGQWAANALEQIAREQPPECVECCRNDGTHAPKSGDGRVAGLDPVLPDLPKVA